MKERRGTVGRLTGLAEGVAASARRRQRDRSPRVLLYDAAGHPRTVVPEEPCFEAIVRAAERMIGVAEEGGVSPSRAEAAAAAGDAERASRAAGPSSPRGVSVREPRTERDSD